MSKYRRIKLKKDTALSLMRSTLISENKLINVFENLEKDIDTRTDIDKDIKNFLLGAIGIIKKIDKRQKMNRFFKKKVKSIADQVDRRKIKCEEKGDRSQ